MEKITELTKIDFLTLFISICTILASIRFLTGLFEWFIRKLGLKTKWTRRRRAEHELLIQTSQNLDILQKKHTEDVRQSIRHDEILKDSVQALSDKVETLSKAIMQMREEQDKDKLAEYKDKIGSSYRCYHERKYSQEEPIPYLSDMEKEALEGLIEQYERHGGKNSFIHTIVEPEMQTWKVIDSEDL